MYGFFCKHVLPVQSRELLCVISRDHEKKEKISSQRMESRLITGFKMIPTYYFLHLQDTSEGRIVEQKQVLDVYKNLLNFMIRKFTIYFDSIPPVWCIYV